MYRLIIITIILVFSLLACSVERTHLHKERRESFYNFTVQDLHKQDISFSEYEGKVVLLVNISLKCGTSHQLHDIQDLYETYQSEGLVVLGFPSDDFTQAAEPREADVIHGVCKNKYGVSFPLFPLGSVKGEGAQPVFQHISKALPDDMSGDVHFNFEKFLVDRKGEVRFRYGSFTSVKSTKFKRELLKLLDE